MDGITGLRRVLVIGHTSKDVNIIKDKTRIAPGGGVFFSSIAAIRLVIKTSALTKCKIEDRSLFQELVTTGVAVHFSKSTNTTSCVNHYPTDDPADRRQKFNSLAEPFNEKDIDKLEDQDIVHINPLWYGEFPEHLIPRIKAKCKFLIGDAQGFLRVVDADGKISHSNWPKKSEYLKYFDLFKFDNKEAELLFGTEDIKEAAKHVIDMGAKMAIATQSDKVAVHNGSTYYEAYFGSYKIEGRTGRGDTATISFISGLIQKKDFQTALRDAARITTEKMQYAGPYQGPTDKIQKKIQSKL